MAADQDNEVLMLMVDDKGFPLPAECQTDVSGDSSDPLVNPTQQDAGEALPVFTNGQFFQVEDFKFGLNIDDEDPNADAANPRGKEGAGVAQQNRPTGPQVKFWKWKSGTRTDIDAMLKNNPYRVNMDELSITRIYDRASAVLFEKCATSATFQRAALIKRKTTGADKLESFMRLDFKDVLVTHIDWTDGEVIKEQFRFVFRRVLFQYRAQALHGKLLAPMSCAWQYTTKLVTPPKK